MWGFKRSDYFEDLERFLYHLRAKGYRFTSLTQLYGELAANLSDNRGFT